MMRTSLFVLLLGALAYGQNNHQVSKADVDRWMKEFSNWERWGKDDELGALNLITPSTRKQAASQVKDGVSVSLEHVDQARSAVRIR